MMNNPIQRRSLTEEVALTLQQEIQSGKYQENEKLPVEAELMKAFGVGRSTIREAIKTLVHSGYLRVQQGLGTFVERTPGIKEPLNQRLKRADARDLDEVRRLLEMKTAENAAEARTAADLKKIKLYLKQREDAIHQNNVKQCIEADLLFHIAIAEASGNEILSDMYTSFANQLRSYFLNNYRDVTVFSDTQELHSRLLKSIETRNAEKAWQYASEIICYDSN